MYSCIFLYTCIHAYSYMSANKYVYIYMNMCTVCMNTCIHNSRTIVAKHNLFMRTLERVYGFNPEPRAQSACPAPPQGTFIQGHRVSVRLHSGCLGGYLRRAVELGGGRHRHKFRFLDLKRTGNMTLHLGAWHQLPCLACSCFP